MPGNEDCGMIIDEDIKVMFWYCWGAAMVVDAIGILALSNTVIFS